MARAQQTLSLERPLGWRGGAIFAAEGEGLVQLRVRGVGSSWPSRALLPLPGPAQDLVEARPLHWGHTQALGTDSLWLQLPLVGFPWIPLSAPRGPRCLDQVWLSWVLLCPQKPPASSAADAWPQASRASPGLRLAVKGPSPPPGPPTASGSLCRSPRALHPSKGRRRLGAAHWRRLARGQHFRQADAKCTVLGTTHLVLPPTSALYVTHTIRWHKKTSPLVSHSRKC